MALIDLALSHARRYWPSVRLPLLSLWLAVGLFTSIADQPLCAQDLPRPDRPLRFQSPARQVVREGHVSLAWNPVDDAVAYQVRSVDGISFYRGVALQSFISGLSNGTYGFQVYAFDSRGEIIATSNLATVDVQHWPLSYALGLFVVGFVVVISVLFAIARGSYGARMGGGS